MKFKVGDLVRWNRKKFPVKKWAEGAEDLAIIVALAEEIEYPYCVMWQNKDHAESYGWRTTMLADDLEHAE